MRVIPGNGPDDRSELEARLLKLGARCVHAADARAVLQTAVDGIAAILDVGCFAVVLTPADGTIGVAAQAESDADFAASVNARRIPLSADNLISSSILGATWIVQRAGGSEPGSSDVLNAHPEQVSFSATAAVPLIGDAGTIGAFVMYAMRETAFAARHMDSLMSFGSIVAQDLARREQRTSALTQQGQTAGILADIAALNSELSERAVLDKVGEYLKSVSRTPLAIAWRLQGNRFTPIAIFGAAASAGFTRTFISNADANMPIGQGPLGRAARTGDISYVKDTLADRSFAPWVDIAQTHRLRSVLAVPLLTDARAMIVVELYAHDVDAFDEATIEKIRTYMPHAQTALRNALDADGLRALARDRALAVSAASGISRGLEEAEVVRSIARASVEALGASFAIAYVSNGGLQVAGGWNAPADLSAKLAVNITDPAFVAYPAVQAVREARYAARSNVITDSAWIRLGWEQIAREHGFNAVSAFPLLVAGKAIGAVALFYAERIPALESEEEIVRQLGTQGGSAIDAARRFEQAKSARNFLDRILEESNDAIVQVDLRGNVVSWNKGAERIFGIPRDDAVGRLFSELPIIPPERRDDIREMISRVGRGEQVHVFEVECRNREGGHLEVLLSASPARDQYGNIVGLVAFSKDISEQKKQLEQLARQNRSLIIMRDVVRSLSREVGLGDICTKGLEKLLEVLHLDVGRLYLYDAADSRLHNVAQRGFEPEGEETVDVTSAVTGEEGPLSIAVAYRQTMLTSDGGNLQLEHPYLSHRTMAEVSSVLTKPLTIGDDIIGAIQVVGFDDRRFSVEDQSIFHAVTDELAVALRHARMLEESSRMAITDPLTGLYNYRFTQDVLRKRLSEARRRKRPLSVVMVDVDSLHDINERYGREVGDQVLRQYGKVLTASVRISDIVARYGGDEFIILLPETQLSDAVMLAERMASNVAEAEWPTRDGDITVTASLGVASFPEAGTQMQMLLKAADAALYRAKQGGRNTVYPRLDTLPRFAG